MTRQTKVGVVEKVEELNTQLQVSLLVVREIERPVYRHIGIGIARPEYLIALLLTKVPVL